jgi:intergrase/recombinase
MEALAAYAKYNGSYDKWQQIRQCYSLHWTNGDESVQALLRFFNTELSLDKMIELIKEIAHKLPPLMGEIVKFGTLTGLRPTEILESVRLINNNQTFPVYYNAEQMTLQHYKFPDIFLRHTKKAFVSFVPTEIINNLKSHEINKIPSYNAIRKACNRKGIACDLRFCRKVHGSWLHKSGIASEEIDFLQGRTSPSVFCRHYLTPDSSLRPRVLESLSGLKQEMG